MKNLFMKRVFVSAGLALVLGALSIPAAGAAPSPKATKSTSPAYDFKGKTLQGRNFSGQELVGKPAVLWFWAAWCAKCRIEAPDLVALANSFKGKVKVVGIAGLAPIPDMKRFVADTGTGNFTHLADTSGTVWGHFQIVTQPSLVFITSKGVMKTRVGGLSKSDLYAMTRELVTKS